MHQNVIPRTAHEGIQFDKAGNMYFIDELDGGNVYKFTLAAQLGKRDRRTGRLLRCRANVRPAGRQWQHTECGRLVLLVPFTNANGAPLPGAITITDVDGITSVDASRTTNLAQFKGTDYQRPEDMQMQTVVVM